MVKKNMASRLNQGIQRVLGKLEASVNSGNYYEAHQMYRTLYFRYLAQKKYSDLLELLYNGAILLLQREQHTSGADLGILFIDVLTKSQTEGSKNYFEKITNLFNMMKIDSPERETFLYNALRWSSKQANGKWGHPDLHRMIAQIFWQEKNYIMARQHFIYSHDGVGCASMLVELHQERGYSNEVDLFITQIVLQYLCLQNTTTAQEVFDSYTSRHPKINSEPPYRLPLLNFLFFLLKTIQLSVPKLPDTVTNKSSTKDSNNFSFSSSSLAAFTVLCEQYQISINRDPSYKTYLDKIAQLFFNAPAPRPRRQGIFGSIVQSFFNGLEDDESDVEERENSNNASTSYSVQELD